MNKLILLIFLPFIKKLLNIDGMVLQDGRGGVEGLMD